jgi:phosphoglycolate phosphatase-like HAD superfamily hydrolase
LLTCSGAEPSCVGFHDRLHACLFDFNGVLTQPAKVHAAAWTEMFDAYPQERAARTGERFSPSTRAFTRGPSPAEPSLVPVPARIERAGATNDPCPATKELAPAYIPH